MFEEKKFLFSAKFNLHIMKERFNYPFYRWRSSIGRAADL